MVKREIDVKSKELKFCKEKSDALLDKMAKLPFLGTVGKERTLHYEGLDGKIEKPFYFCYYAGIEEFNHEGTSCTYYVRVKKEEEKGKYYLVEEVALSNDCFRKGVNYSWDKYNAITAIDNEFETLRWQDEKHNLDRIKQTRISAIQFEIMIKLRKGKRL